MFSDAEITAALAALEPANDPVAGKLSTRTVRLLLPALRTSPRIRRRPGAYFDLETKLADAAGYDAVQLQAIFRRLQGPQADAGDVAKAGGKSAIFFRKSENRNAMLDLALGVLYEPILENTTGQHNANAQMINPATERYLARGFTVAEDDVTARGQS